MKHISTSILLGLVLFAFQTSFAQIQVLTGTENGTYFELAKDMNKLLPQKVKGEKEVDFIDARATQGSSFNFDLLVDPTHPAKAAFMQIDLLLLKKTEDMFNDTKFTDDLVILMPLTMEEIHLVTKLDTEMNALEDLEGKTIGIGTKTEGTYSTAMYIQNTSKLPWQNKIVNTQDALKALLLDKIDAFFVVSAAPMQMLSNNPINAPLRLKLVNVNNVNGWADYYTPTTLDAGTYLWQKEAVNTFSVPSVIVVNKSKLTEKDISDLKQWKATTLENIELLKTTGHPSWKTAKPSDWKSQVWPMLD